MSIRWRWYKTSFGEWLCHPWTESKWLVSASPAGYHWRWGLVNPMDAPVEEGMAPSLAAAKRTCKRVWIRRFGVWPPC